MTAQKLEELGYLTCQDIQQADLRVLLTHFGKAGRVLWERCHGIDPRPVTPDRLRKSVGVERTLSEDIQDWTQCQAQIETLCPELEARLRQVSPDLSIVRQGVKLRFDDFQITTQETVRNTLDQAGLLLIARQMWEQRRQGRGVRLVGLHVTLRDPAQARQLPLDL